MAIRTPSNAVTLSGAQTVAGVKTFSSFPVGPSSAPTTDYQMANKKYVDDASIIGGVGYPGVTAIVLGAGVDASALSWASAANGIYNDLVGSCDGTNDHTEINAAISALTAGRTWIETVKLIGGFTPAASIVLPSYTRIDASEAYLYWDVTGDTLFEAIGTKGATDTVDLTGIASAHKGDAIITVDEDIFAIGDYVMIQDETVWQSTHKNGEIHRVAAISAGTITLDGFLWHDYTSTPKAAKISTAHDIEVMGGRVIGASATQDVQMYVVRFVFCSDFKVQRMHTEKVSSFNVQIHSSINGDVSNNRVWGIGRADWGYGFDLTAACNQVQVHHNLISYCRHGTSGGHDNSNSYYGAPVDCSYSNNTIVGGVVGQGAALMDMHECNSLGCRWDYNTLVSTEDVSYKGLNLGCTQWSAKGNIINMIGSSPAIGDRGNYVQYVTIEDTTLLGTTGIYLDSTALLSVTVDGVDANRQMTYYVVKATTSQSASYVKIANVKNPYGSSAYDGISTSGFTHVEIVANDIHACDETGIQLAGATGGLVALNCANNNGKGGGHTGIDACGISLSNCTNLLVTANQCSDTQTGSETQEYGIGEFNTCDNNKIVGNDCRGNVTTDILRVGAGTIIERPGLVTVEAHTADDTLTLGETGSIHTNKGDAGTQTLTLPALAPAGTTFTFCVMAAVEMRICISAASKAFYVAGAITTDDGAGDLYVVADDEGETLTLVADGAGNWFASSVSGTWTVVQP